MSDLHQEISDLKVKQARTDEAVKGFGQIAQEMHSLNQNLNKLFVKMEEREVREEYLKKDVEKLKVGFEDIKPVVDKARQAQENKKKFWDGALGNWGKIFSGVVVAIVVLYFFPNAIELIKGK
jgi:hypothetical protein